MRAVEAITPLIMLFAVRVPSSLQGKTGICSLFVVSTFDASPQRCMQVSSLDDLLGVDVDFEGPSPNLHGASEFDRDYYAQAHDSSIPVDFIVPTLILQFDNCQQEL